MASSYETNQSIGIIEFVSIARGIETTDIMVKVSNVDIIKASTICPGKYLAIISGKVEDVETAIKTGSEFGGEYVSDTLVIARVHPQLIPAISMSNTIENPESIGILEFYSVPAGIFAADAAAKAANIELIEVKIGYAIGGKSVVVLTGDLSSVQTAVNISDQDQDLMLLNKVVIANPDPSILTTLL
ncbi:MAG: BMC domain-containing protein [Clostridiales Family XIII bacterium]|nr:BMC domain-containing protein [Clostridiales Family XIII bacterium]